MIMTTEAWYRWSDVLFWYQSMPEGSLEVSSLHPAHWLTLSAVPLEH